MIPSPLVSLALALAVFRTYRLLARDDFPPIVRLRNAFVGARFGVSKKVTFARPLLADWLVCAWCSGLWFSAGWYVAWLIWPRATVYAAVPLALSAGVGIVQSFIPD